jgi:hypothetical protein
MQQAFRAVPGAAVLALLAAALAGVPPARAAGPVATAVPAPVAPSPKSTEVTYDHSDIYWPDGEDGWGIQLVQNAGTIFLTMFVYGTGGQATWTIGVLQHAGGEVFTGSLYQTTGGTSWLQQAFSNAGLVETAVGTARLEPSAPGVPDSDLRKFSYTVGATTVVKILRRQSLALSTLAGGYAGTMNRNRTGCTDPLQNGSDVGIPIGLDLTQTGTAVTGQFAVIGKEDCQLTGTYTQAGRFGAVDAEIACSTGSTGILRLYDVQRYEWSIVAKFTQSYTPCSLVTGVLTATRLP